METFTFIASHDLRAPLVNLKGFAGEMQLAIEKIMPILYAAEDKFTPEQWKTLHELLAADIPESLNFIMQSVDKMDALTTAVLDLSRIGKHEYRCEPVDTHAVVQRCLGTLAFEIAQNGISVSCEPLPVIDSDPLALEQVFSNLLDNAVKYLDPARPGKIEIAARQERPDVIFAIRDNGRGIAPEDSNKVFQIFRRARNSTDVRGMGMGMAFVQSTVRRLGGSIWFTSQVGQGTVFYIKLPLKPATKGERR